MPLLILLLFVGVPILEIAVFIQAGDLIGLWPTIAVVILTGIAGTIMLRVQGFGVIRRIQEQSDQGHVPVFELFEGLCLLVAGLLLLTPGFVTDSVGFLLFLPPFRKLMAQAIAARVAVHGASAFTFRAGPGGPQPGGGRGSTRPGGTVIDGEYQKVDREAPHLTEGKP